MTKSSLAAAEAWDKAMRPPITPSCSTCIHSCLAMSAAPCDRCEGGSMHEPRHIIDRGDRAHAGLDVRFTQGDPE